MSEPAFEIAGASDPGRKRRENQDHFLIADLRRQLIIRDTDVADQKCDQMYGCREGKLLVIADGMGGHQQGERASRTAVESCERYVLDMMHWFLKLSSENEQDFLDELSNCLTSIQQQIWSVSDGDPDRRMGTTVTMAYLVWPRLYVVHAGDSRCYLLREGSLEQLTTDHTIAQQMIDAGALSEQDAETSRWRHVLWNCVGGGGTGVRPEAIRTDLEEGDVVLLCSDGLTGMIPIPMIERTLAETASSKDAVASLISQANEAGGDDNISVIVARTLPADKLGQVCFGDDLEDTLYEA